jgi:hypothetical protein
MLDHIHVANQMSFGINLKIIVFLEFRLHSTLLSFQGPASPKQS